MPKLLAIAEEVTKLSAVCMVCGGNASRSQRIAGARGDSAARVLVGAKDLYEARCRFCHEPYENIEQGELGLPAVEGTA